ncbi:MAG: hypothetical protein ACI867_002535 [Glaciecola sp.]|jgi:hypothetical protein
MPARLLCLLALLWAVGVPLLHGHPPGSGAHAQAPLGVEHHVEPSVVGADVTVLVTSMGAGLGEHEHAEHGDLPLPLLPSLLLLVLPGLWRLFSGQSADRSQGTATWLERPRDRGSPVARHEVARI